MEGDVGGAVNYLQFNLHLAVDAVVAVEEGLQPHHVVYWSDIEWKTHVLYVTNTTSVLL